MSGQHITTRDPSVTGGLGRELAAAGIVATDAEWRPFYGGRTNRIWRVGAGAEALVCKLFDPTGDTLLFPNDIAAEALALRALSGTGLAPDFVAETTTNAGACLIYRHIEGEPWHEDVGAVARTLRRLHAHPAPVALRRIASGSQAIAALGHSILADCRSAVADRLGALRPKCDVGGSRGNAFLHGDVVPGNIISTAAGTVLIDWQCPAIGDPCEDLAVFLSPAMQWLYGHRPLSAAEQRRFLQAYGDPDIVERYLALQPLFHWRMAAHCLWKSERGNVDYRAAMDLELAALKQD